MIEVKIEASAFLRAMRAARKRFAEAVIAAVRHAAELALEQARATNNFKDQTGALRKSIRASFGQYEGHVDATAKHAVWVERGNGPVGGYIYPKHAPMLVFHIGGRKIVTHRVKTSAPRHFMADAAKHAKPFFERACEDAARNMFA